MRRINFCLIAIFSFFFTTWSTFFVSGTFLNRVLAAVSCTIFSFNSAVCISNLRLESDAAMATSVNLTESSSLSNLVADSYPSQLKILASNDDYQEPNLCPSEQLFAGKTKDQQERLRNLYNKALGVKEKLRERRDNFLKTQLPEDIFPTFYYHTTVNSLAKINEGNLAYPDIALEEIIRFYSAYEYNRLQVKKESHWEAYYDEAASIYKSNTPISSGDALGGAYGLYSAGLLSLAVKAHIEFDLPRALSSIFIENQNMSASEKEEMKKDFFSFDDVFEKASEDGFNDLSKAILEANPGLLPAGINLVPGKIAFGKYSAQEKRKKAWENAEKKSLPTKDAKPPDEIEDLAIIGAQACKENLCQSKDNQDSPECQLKEGKSYGDPHLVTFDGLSYSFQTVGEYTLVKSKNGDFEVQVRQTPFNSSLSLNSAVAMKLGADRVAFYTKDFPDADSSTPVRVNSKPITILEDKFTLPGGGVIAKKGSTYVVNSTTGEKVVISTLNAGGNPYFNVSPFVYNQPAKYSGLLGNVNGNLNDDQQIQGGGNVLEIQSTYGEMQKVFNLVGLRLPGQVDVVEKLYFDKLYKDFGNSWLIKPEKSLFDYLHGKTTENYTDPSFPDKYLKLDMLSSEQIEKARKLCTESGVDQNLMEGCIFDVGFSGFSEFSLAMSQIDDYVKLVNQLFPGLNIPSVNSVIEKVKPKVCLPGIGCL